MSDFTFNFDLAPGAAAAAEGAAAAAGPTAQPTAATGLDKKKKKPPRTGRVRGLSKKRKAKKEALKDQIRPYNPLSIAAQATVESRVRAAKSRKKKNAQNALKARGLDIGATEWTPSAQSEPSTNINTLLGQSFYHIDSTNMRVIPNNQKFTMLYPKNNIYGNFSNDACLKLLKYLTVTTKKSNSNNLHSTEAFIILNDTIFYGYGFKNLNNKGTVPIHVETFLMLNLVKAIEQGKIQGVYSITIYSTLQPCCMCSLIIHQGIMYLRSLLEKNIKCNIFYCNKDGLMKVFRGTRPGQNQPPSYWNYSGDITSLTRGPGQRDRNPKTTLINHLCLVPGQRRSGAVDDYNLRQMFERGQDVPTKDALNLLKKKFFHSDTTKLIIVGDNYRRPIGSEINVSYQRHDIRRGAKKSYFEQIMQDTETFKLLQIIDYFYLNASGHNRFGKERGTYNIMGARKINTFLSGFTLLNAPPDCPLRRLKDLKTPRGTTTAKGAATAAEAAAAEAAAATGKGNKTPPNLRACSIPTYQVHNLINEPIYLNNLIISDQSKAGKSDTIKNTETHFDGAAGMGGYKKTKRKRKKRRNKKTIKKKRKKSRKTRKKRKSRKRRK